jgi:hypothetical protein
MPQKWILLNPGNKTGNIFLQLKKPLPVSKLLMAFNIVFNNAVSALLQTIYP